MHLSDTITVTWWDGTLLKVISFVVSYIVMVKQNSGTPDSRHTDSPTSQPPPTMNFIALYLGTSFDIVFFVIFPTDFWNAQKQEAQLFLCPLSRFSMKAQCRGH